MSDPNYIIQNNTLLIFNKQKINWYLLSLMLSLFICIILIFALPQWHILIIGIEALFTTFIISFKPGLFKYIYISNINIQLENDFLLINKKKFYYKEILFLSFVEDEECQIVRLEGKRKHILIPNQKILFTNCKNFNDAINKCSMIKNFIQKPIQVNFITHIASSYGRKTEKWNFIEL